SALYSRCQGPRAELSAVGITWGYPKSVSDGSCSVCAPKPDTVVLGASFCVPLHHGRHRAPVEGASPNSARRHDPVLWGRRGSFRAARGTWPSDSPATDLSGTVAMPGSDEEGLCPRWPMS